MLSRLFFASLIGFLILYILRGIRIITFIPGGIILVLLLLTLFIGIFLGIKKTKAY